MLLREKGDGEQPEQRVTGSLMTVAALALAIYASMIAWVPLAEHASLERSDVTEARYSSIANDIAEVVHDAPSGRVQSELFEGELLAAIGSYESHYAARVDDCRDKHAKSFSIFQVSTNRAYVCGDRKNAVRVALFRVRESFAVSSALPFSDRLGFYATGFVVRSWYSRSRVDRALAAMPRAANDDI